MSEPKRLLRGKEFQEIVRKDFAENDKKSDLRFEEHLKLLNSKRGRLDIFISDVGDGVVAIYEIKATNWDNIKTKNIKKNAWSHQHQLFKYVDMYVKDNIDVCLGIIYPEPPQKEGLRETIENYLEKYGIPAYWFNEIKSN
ncbi:MAG: hypothetical protein D8M58_21380 [Calditrichaeota bacterium]|nr:MAG: hypothetical protein DWQ03_00105 [Calditrichota bacterium]MBL1207966.1 hypothetical protein [Calditrichota bacterium]NOG47802.1 hypothetical protein [Calditrichota bacterium]